jgi:tetratricopeptide (TPR) repeat protein
MVSGIVLLLIVLILFLKTLKERVFFIPLSFIVFFLFGHLLLVYSPLADFRASSRFMMIPVVGFIWILYFVLKRFKPFISYTTFSALALLFIPALIINASIYKSEVSYWKKFSQSFPNDSYILFHTAEALFENKPVESIFILNKALRENPRFTTFVDMSLLYEEIESRRGNYKKALEWLNRIKIVPNLNLRKKIKFREAKIYLALGEVEKVEKILNESFKGYGEGNYYSFIYRMYHGFERWEKAETIEKSIYEKFPDLIQTGTKQIREKIRKFTPDQRLAFFLEHHNYKKSIEIVLSFPKNLSRDLFLAKLYYLYGKQGQAELIIEDYVSKNPDNFKIFNSIGTFFLNEMIMVEKAHFFLKKSLTIKKEQPELIRLVNYLEKNM